MTAADVTDFFLTLCERADNNVNVAVNALAAGEAVGIHAPTVFAHVHALKVRGWIEDAPPSPMGGLHVHLSVAGRAGARANGCAVLAAQGGVRPMKEGGDERQPMAGVGKETGDGTERRAAGGDSSRY